MGKKIYPSSPWMLSPTPKQRRAIARLATRLGIKEHIEDNPSNRMEARQLQYDLRCKLRKKEVK